MGRLGGSERVSETRDRVEILRYFGRGPNAVVGFFEAAGALDDLEDREARTGNADDDARAVADEVAREKEMHRLSIERSELDTDRARAYRDAGVTLPAVRPITFPDAPWYRPTLEAAAGW